MKKKITSVFIALLFSQISLAQGCQTPAPTGNSQQTFCSSNNPLVSSLSATGTAISWYLSEDGGVALSQSAPLSNGLYYAAQTDQGCESTARLAVEVIVHAALPDFPGIISGSQMTCEGSQNVYSINPVANADYYIWTLPSMLDGISQTNSISTTAIADGSGMMLVSAQNACGNSGNQSKGVNVSALPDQPSIISGDNEVCSQTFQTYSIDPVLYATSYLWTKPSGWSGLSNTTTFNAGIGQNSGMISVVAINSCGTSVPLEMEITVLTIPSNPGSIVGNSYMCSGSEQTYFVNPVSNVDSYTWNFPSDWTGSSTSNSIDLIAGELTGIITVNAVNECGTNSSVMGVNVTVSPEAPTGNALQTFCNSGTVYDLFASGNSIQWFSTIDGTEALSSSEFLVNGGIYFATQSDMGCTSLDRLEVEVEIQTPAAPAGEAVQIFCNSASVNDLVSVGNNVQWYSTIDGTIAMNSTDQLVDGDSYFATQTENDCESEDRLEVQININPMPNNMIDLSGITLTASQANASYQWIDCNDNMAVLPNETSQSFTATANGDYAVEINLNGCIDTSTCQEITTVSLDDLSSSRLKLFPNPSTDKFIIEDENGIDQVVVFSMAGELMLTETFAGTTSTELIPKLNPGVYLVKVTDSSGNLHITQWVKL